MIQRFWQWLMGLFGKRIPEAPSPHVENLVDTRHPWNTPQTRKAKLYKWSDHPPRQQASSSKRDRAKCRRYIKHYFGLTRRDMGAIGAGHMEPPDGYYQMRGWLGV